MEWTRDPEAICQRSKPPFHIESSGAVVMRPASGDLWAVWGLPAENEYEHFRFDAR
jgi:isopenicillin-N N-acyltransferase-like protein